MADLTPLNYNPENVEDLGDGFKVIPPGTYNVIIVESDVADTKAGTGKILKLKYQIIDGANVGDTIADNINIINPSEVAQKIGQSQLKNICDAIGHKGLLKDSTQLHGKPLAVKVVIEDFTSNTTGKVLQSNKVEKRMPKQSASSAAPASGGADAAPKKAMGW
jgi:hypothetical protein